MIPIAKSTCLQSQICPKDTWLRLHKPDLVQVFAPTEFEKHLMEQGNEAETHAPYQRKADVERVLHGLRGVT